MGRGQGSEFGATGLATRTVVITREIPIEHAFSTLYPGEKPDHIPSYVNGGFVGGLAYDYDAPNPRIEKDNLCRMEFVEQRDRHVPQEGSGADGDLSLGDVEEAHDYGRFDDLTDDDKMEWLEEAIKARIGDGVLIRRDALSVGYSQGDSIEGFAYVPEDAIEREYGAVNEETKEKARKRAEVEMEEYARWASGDTYGCLVYDSNGDEVGATWGLIGDDYAEARMKEDVDDAAERAAWEQRRPAVEGVPFYDIPKGEHSFPRKVSRLREAGVAPDDPFVWVRAAARHTPEFVRAMRETGLGAVAAERRLGADARLAPSGRTAL
jgi:hypothetical protein